MNIAVRKTDPKMDFVNSQKGRLSEVNFEWNHKSKAG